MKNIVHYEKNALSFQAWLSKVLPHLQQLKKENNRIAFDSLMEKVLPEVKQYINRQLAASLKHNKIPKGKYKVEDFTDELYIEAYDNIENLTQENLLHRWLFSKADKMLEDTLIEEDFDHMYIKNIDDYSKKEWASMEENFTRDGDGDLVMIEELDDLSYAKQDYTLEDVFIENIEEAEINKLNAQLTKQTIHHKVNSALLMLPFQLRTIFELSVNQQFEVEEIADIKKMTTQEVEEILTNAKNIIRSCFFNQHLQE